MYLKSDRISITLSGTVFRTYSVDPQPVYEFVLDPDAISGWYDGTSVRRTGEVRPNSWGDFTEPSTKGSRTMSLTGTVVASSVANLQVARDKFTGLLQTGEYVEMRVQAATNTARTNERIVEQRYINVGLEGTPSWARLSDTVAAWKIDLYAPNPRIYGAEQTAQIGDGSLAGGLSYPLNYPLNYGIVKADQVYIANDGNTPAWPTFKVTGDFPSGFHIKDNKGSIVTYLGMVTETSPVTIDMAAGSAIQNKTDRSINLSRRDWFSIPASSSIRPSFEPIQDGFGWCDIMYRDTWI